jgi:aminomethyltransferase
VLQSGADVDLSATKKNDTFTCQLWGRQVRLARTGYTGEDGFEVFCQNGDAERLWLLLLEAGVVPCGLGARDTLRLEAGFPLYGHEFTDQTSPLATPLAWVVKAHKSFYGKEAMLGQPISQKLVGIVLEQGIPREGYPVLHQGEVAGKVTSGTISPLTKKGIAFAYIDAELAEVGRAVEVEIRGKGYPGTVVTPPFMPK